MRIHDGVHALKIPFRISVAPGRILERFVYVYLLEGDGRVALIDAGVAGSVEPVSAYLRSIGRDIAEVELVCLTHAHPDHIGGASEIQAASGCRFVAHVADKPWIEDVARQKRERPVPGFDTLVAGPVTVGFPIADGDVIGIPGGRYLEVIHTPGHSRGHLAFSLPEAGILFSGDALPLPGDMPIYEDPVTALASLEKLRGISGVRMLCSSWDDPRSGEEVAGIFDGAAGVFRNVHAAVMAAREEMTASPDGGAGDDPDAVADAVITRLNLPPTCKNPIFIATVRAHLEAIRQGAEWSGPPPSPA